MDKIYFNDQEKEKKLEQAITHGFIEKSEADGLVQYTLTQRGMQQWAGEKYMGMAQSFTFRFV